jgi:hypothetical protein
MPRLALLAMRGGVVPPELPEPDEPPVPPEPLPLPEVPELLPEPLVLPEPLLLPDPLVLPDPLPLPEVPELLPDPLVLPVPLVPLDPLDVPDPLDPPELLDPLALPDPAVPEPPESVEPLVVLAADAPVLSPLPPPQAVTTNATRATSNPLRTNDVFIIQQLSSSQHRPCARIWAHRSNPQATSRISGRIPPTTVRQTATVRNATRVPEGT